MIRDSDSVSPAAAHYVAARAAARGYLPLLRGMEGGRYEVSISNGSRLITLMVIARRWAARSGSGRDRDAIWSWTIPSSTLDGELSDRLFALIEMRDWPDLDKRGAVGPRIYLVQPSEVREQLTEQLAQRTVGLIYRFDFQARKQHRERWSLLAPTLRDTGPEAPAALKQARRVRAEAEAEDAGRSTIIDLERRRDLVAPRDDETWISLPTES